MRTVNDDPTNAAVREARERISASVGHDPRKLVEHYRQLQERHRERVVPAATLKPNGDARPS